LPADKPIVAALRLPERLMASSSPYYDIQNLISVVRTNVRAAVAHDARLRGVFCANVAEATAAAGAGAEFLVLCEVLSPSELAALCQLVSVPVYARGLALEEAWALGASGTNEINV
jgi:hypothetical protein